jgi:colanic acid/amylovoran biosynthesis glycosyltransferase
MRVLIGTVGFPNLSETFILNQITGLLDRGHDVTIWAANKADPDEVTHQEVEEYNLQDRLICNPVPYEKGERLAKSLWRMLRHRDLRMRDAIGLINPLKFGRYGASLRLLNHVLALKGQGPFDVMHCHFGPVGRSAAVLKRIGVLDCPLVVSFHGYDVHSYVRKKGVDVYSEMFEWVDLITVNSNYVGEKVAELGGENIVRHPVGLDPTKFVPNYDQPESTEPVQVLTVGRLVEVKGIKYSIRAVAQAIDAGYDIRYKIVGGGPRREELDELIWNLGVGECVEILGIKRQEDVIDLLAESQAFILAGVTGYDGDTEGQGLVLQEAQAAGLPVITTWNGGIPEGVIPGTTALMAPPRDVDTLCEKVKVVVSSPEKRVRMGKAGREFVLNNFDIRDLNDRLTDIYRSVM